MKNKPMKRDKGVILLCFVWGRLHEVEKKRKETTFDDDILLTVRQHISLIVSVLMVVTMLFVQYIF